MEMKNTYKVRFKYGLLGEALVTALDENEAAREAYSLCVYNSAFIPKGYSAKDIVESVELTDLHPGIPGYAYRPVVEKMTHDDCRRRFNAGKYDSFSLSAPESAV